MTLRTKEIIIIIVAVVVIVGVVYFSDGTREGGALEDGTGSVATSTEDEVKTPTSQVTPKPSSQKPTSNTTNTPNTKPSISPAGFSLGQTIKFPGVTLTTMGIVEDSRCPSGSKQFACIWAGTVRVTARLRLDTMTSANPDDILEFTIGVPQKYGDYDITLMSVLPYPTEGKSIRESDYRFTWFSASRY